MPPFNFKKFKIHHDHSFKVGTDGVLLGTWVNVEGKQNILDIGSGSGLIPLVIAQRTTTATISGVEIDQESVVEANQNVEESPWSDRVSIYCDTAQAYSAKRDDKYDLIVSNPPYFINATKSNNKKKDTARHTDQLPFEDLITVTNKHLTMEGKLAVVLPNEEGNIFMQLAKENELYLTRLTEVRSKKDKPVERYLMEFGRIESELKKDELVIQFEKRNDYTPAYIALTKEFYTIL